MPKSSQGKGINFMNMMKCSKKGQWKCLDTEKISFIFEVFKHLSINHILYPYETDFLQPSQRTYL